MAKFKVSEHSLVSKHEKLSSKEVEKLCEKFHIITKQLPKILIKDPALTGLSAKVGDVIKISRDSPTAGKTEFYRRVSDV